MHGSDQRPSNTRTIVPIYTPALSLDEATAPQG
jgi:hypothetical protein